MPTYEFECPSGHQFERFYRKISDAVSELPCPECGLVATRRLSRGAGLIFKGSGFYITDYGKDGKKARTPEPAPGSEGKPASKSETSASGPSESKAGESKPAEQKPTPTPKDSSGSE